MEETHSPIEYTFRPPVRAVNPKRVFTYFLHVILFLATIFTTTLAGALWVNKDPLVWKNFHYGLPYSLALVAMLSAHEFGHYFAARFHGVKTTLPFFIPFPPFFINPFGPINELIQLNPFGTMGAVIRIRSPLGSKRTLFDIGIAGPIAGLVVTAAILLFGLVTLPGKEYLYMMHPEYRFMDSIPDGGLTFGNSILFWFIRKTYLALHGPGFMPPMNEIYHYPFLCVGWFGLFITALNLLPVGQLDGGHVLYALAGNRQGLIARIFFGILVLFGLMSFLPLFGFKVQPGTAGWLVWAALLFFVIKLDHPPIYDFEPLNPGRKVLGWCTMILFVLIFPPVPIYE